MVLRNIIAFIATYLAPDAMVNDIWPNSPFLPFMNMRKKLAAASIALHEASHIINLQY